MVDSRKRNLWPFPAGRDLKEWGDRLVQILRKGDYLDLGAGLSYSGGILVQAVPGFAQGRLTLTTAVPVTTSDVTAAATLYYTPYIGNLAAVYSNSAWVVRSFSELSLSLSGYTASRPYDIWLYDNGGTLALDSTIWTNDTTRATGLTKQDGAYVKSGDATRLYLGTIRTTSTTGQTEDSVANRLVWNMYHRRFRDLRRLDTADTWSYSTATIRQARASTDNQVSFVTGRAEQAVQCHVIAAASTDATVTVRVGIGIDSTTAFATNSHIGFQGMFAGITYQMTGGVYNLTPTEGYHYLAWLEVGGGAGTQTWYGDNGGNMQNGMYGGLWG